MTGTATPLPSEGQVHDTLTEPNMKAEALALYDAGWWVVPNHWIVDNGGCSCQLGRDCPSPGKHPVCSWKHAQTRRITREEVEIWWDTYPMANIGVITGPASGIVVIDVDVKDGVDGHATLQEHAAAGRDLPATFTDARGDGVHLFFRYPADAPRELRNIQDGKLGPGLDLRAGGGQVIIAPSMHYSGERRRILNSLPPADLPHWVIGLALANSRQETPGRAGALVRQVNEEGSGLPPDDRERFVSAYVRKHFPGKVPAGHRHRAFLQVAGLMRSAGSDAQEIFTFLVGFNQTHCDPPKPNVETELKDIAGYVETKPVTLQPVQTNGDRDLGEIIQSTIKSDVTDARLAEYFRDMCADIVKYCYDDSRWYVWNGRYWEPDEGERVHILYVDAIRRAVPVLLKYDDEKTRKRLIADLLDAEGAKTARNAFFFARSLEGLCRPESGFNVRTSLFNVQNGTLDLETLECRGHRREDMLTRMSNFVYDPAARCPKWEEHVSFMLGGNREWIETLQQVLGVSLLGTNPDQVFNVFYGPGGENGKTTLMLVLRTLFGDYGTSLSPDSVGKARYAKSGADHRTDRLCLKSARVAIVDETEEGRALDMSFLKAITGGSYIKVRGAYQREEEEFKVGTIILYSVNHRPKIRDQSHAAWRRVLLWNCNQKIPPEKKVEHYENVLLQEGPGILNWLLDGLRKWQGAGRKLHIPDSLRAAIEEYRRDENPLQEWMDACLVEKEGAWTSSKELYASYRQFVAMQCEDERAMREVLLSTTKFSLLMGDFYEPYRKPGSGERGFRGVIIRGTDRQANITHSPPRTDNTADESASKSPEPAEGVTGQPVTCGEVSIHARTRESLPHVTGQPVTPQGGVTGQRVTCGEVSIHARTRESLPHVTGQPVTPPSKEGDRDGGGTPDTTATLDDLVKRYDLPPDPDLSRHIRFTRKDTMCMCRGCGRPAMWHSMDPTRPLPLCDDHYRELVKASQRGGTAPVTMEDRG